MGAMAKATQANSSNRALVSVMGRNRSSVHNTRRATMRVYKALYQADLLLVQFSDLKTACPIKG